ncbi:MAG: hypothetical protein Q7K57_15010 [Burkholderiaceae bacterium]|nr:hypothetical protein [Burkholderiaceae bacterium]
MSTTSEVLAYHYEAESKFFLGAEKADICQLTSTPLVPAFATLTPPPILETDGEKIAQFDELSKQWSLVANDFWRPSFSEINYDAERPIKTYAPISLSMYGEFFPAYQSIPMICNSTLVVTALCQRTRAIHEKFNLICSLHKVLLSGVFPQVPLDSPDYAALASSPTLLYRYKLEVESMVYLMRRVLDCLTQLTYLLTDRDEFKRTKRIAHNEIGRVLEKSGKESDFSKVMVGDGTVYEEDKTGFLKTINDLFNSFKHCMMHEESNTLIGIEFPTIVSYHAKHNDHATTIIHHNHSAHHIMMGFQDNVLRILRNQKKFLTVGSTRAPTASPLVPSASGAGAG